MVVAEVQAVHTALLPLLDLMGLFPEEMHYQTLIFFMEILL
jgi:hypothetical protein